MRGGLLIKGVAGLLIGGTLALTSVHVALAESEAISGSQENNVTVSWNKGRTNYRNPSAVTFRLDSQSPSPGGPFGIGLRNAAGQYARADANSGQTVALKTDSGSTAIPAGTFWLNTRPTGRCGGDGCGMITWRGVLNWNL